LLAARGGRTSTGRGGEGTYLFVPAVETVLLGRRKGTYLFYRQGGKVWVMGGLGRILEGGKRRYPEALLHIEKKKERFRGFHARKRGGGGSQGGEGKER